MCSIPNSTGPNSNSTTSFQSGDFTSSFTGQDVYEENVKKAENVSLLNIFKYYKINIDNYNRKIVCPFFKHKGGRESTPSLYFYPETNTFWCFGCKTGITSVDFVANLEQINKFQAALKILNLFKQESNTEFDFQAYRDSAEEKNKLLFDFSKKMRNLVLEKPILISKIENIYAIFDKMNDKYELDINALKSLIDKLNERLDNIK